MDKEKWNSLMGIYMKGNIKVAIRMGKEPTFIIKLEPSMKANGCKINKQVMAFIFIKMEINMSVV